MSWDTTKQFCFYFFILKATVAKCTISIHRIYYNSPQTLILLIIELPRINIFVYYLYVIKSILAEPIHRWPRHQASKPEKIKKTAAETAKKQKSSKFGVSATVVKRVGDLECPRGGDLERTRFPTVAKTPISDDFYFLAVSAAVFLIFSVLLAWCLG